MKYRLSRFLFQRLLRPSPGEARAAFLLGPRKVGKSTLLESLYPNAKIIDLLDTELKTDLTLKPKLLREWVLEERPKLLIVDEIQKVPALLDEIHWCLEHTDTTFLMSGSSARGLKNKIEGGILGGRAWRFELFPLVAKEIGDFNLERALHQGLIPRHYLSKHPDRELKSYISDYLEEEISREVRIRNLPAFHRFLQNAALMSGQLLNYANVGSEVGTSPKTVRAYYALLEETLLGFRLEPWSIRKDRRLIETDKFYLFDCGLVRYLRRLPSAPAGTDAFGSLFEHWILMECRAFRSYREKDVDFFFWRTSNNAEVDLLIRAGASGPPDVAIEIKSTTSIQTKHLTGLRTLSKEFPRIPSKICVSMDEKSRHSEDGILLLHWMKFIERLWDGEIF